MVNEMRLHIYCRVNYILVISALRQLIKILTNLRRLLQVMAQPAGDSYSAVGGNDSNLLIVFYVQIMPDDLVMQLHRF